MRIRKLTLNGFRSYDRAEIAPESGLNLLYGANAAGKTNVLEAVFLCALGRSHRTSKDQEMIGHGLSGAYVGIEAETNTGLRTVEIKLRTGDAAAKNPKDRKQIFIDRQRADKAGDLMGVLNVVMFSPEDLALVKASPDVRRRFMDMELCQLRPAYYRKAAMYNAALRQRNALIKEAFSDPIDPEVLDMWNVQMARTGAEVMRARREFMDQLSTIASDVHRRLSGGREQLFAFYEPNIDFDERDAEYAIYDALAASAEEDIRRGFTTRGPHRDDIGIKLGETDVKVYGSQGQQRTAALSLKLSEIALIRDVVGESPVLLLDDVLSELDEERQKALMNSAFGCQCLLTATGVESAAKDKLAALFEVRDGNITKINR
ncbi:MAG: DNA replication/repair protein RecF [Clostridiales bacterium]|nr:DNA replication/repair protein RecF [Clostridiales bacterium]